MKKTKTILLVSVLVTAGLLLSACTQSASSGEVTPQDDSQLQEILDAVANQTPAAPADDGSGGGPSDQESVQQTQTAQANIPTPVTPAQDKPAPTPTKVPEDLDLVVPETYALKKGEFPWCLARRFDIDAVTLLNANGLSTTGKYAPGLKLTIPQNAPKFQGQRARAAHPASYTVQSGDSFYSIACQYGDVWPIEIAAYNDMQLDANLTSGMTLQIP